MKKNKILIVLIFFILVVSTFLLLFINNKTIINNEPVFDANRAFKHIEQQLAFGPRIPGSMAHQKLISYISDNINDDWQKEIQSGMYMQHDVKNIIAKNGNKGDFIIIAAHYDTRMFADSDPIDENKIEPVQGANDGASGVAVLLELSRVIPKDIDKNVWLVFFDAEDQGNIPGLDWILGSRYFVENLTDTPDSVIVVDMIGDQHLQIFKEYNSDANLTNDIWNIADILGYSKSFIPDYKYTILDDHIPFVEQGIRAIDIIDFDYEYWHTTQDTIDKVSPESLAIVGDTLLTWLVEN